VPDIKKLQDFFKSAEILYQSDKNEIEMESLIEKCSNLLTKNAPNLTDTITELQKSFTQSFYDTKYDGLINALIAKGYFLQGNIAESKTFLMKATDFYSNLGQTDAIASKIISDLAGYYESTETRTIEEKQIENLYSEIDKSPENNAKRYELAILLFKLRKYEDCIKQCLNILKIDRNWNQGKAKDLINQIFAIIGSSSELASNTRKQLSNVLFF